MDTLSELETLVLSEVLPINRAIDWLLVMEGIYGSKTEADESGQTEEEENKDEPSEVDS